MLGLLLASSAMALSVNIAPERTVRVTLEDSIKSAIANNGKLGAAAFDVEAAQAQLTEARARGWPIFEYEYQTAPVPGDVSQAIDSFFSGDVAWLHRMKVGVGLPIYSFGKLSTVKSLAKQGVTASYEQQRRELATVVSEVRQLYYGIQFGDDIRNLLADASKQIQERLNKAEAAGPDTSNPDSLPPTERLKLSVYLAEIEKRADEAEGKQALAREALRIQLGFPPRTRVVLAQVGQRKVNIRLGSLEKYISDAKTSKAEAQLLDVGTEAKRLEYKLEKQKSYPDIGVGGFFELGRTVGDVTGLSATDDFNDPFNFTRAGIGLQLKGRFDPHGAKARVKKKRSEYYKVKTQREIAKEGLSLQAYQAYIEAQTAKEQVVRAERSEKDARRLMFLTKSNLEIGVGDNNDYAESLKSVLLSRAQHLESIFNWNKSIAKLDEAIGVIPNGN